MIQEVDGVFHHAVTDVAVVADKREETAHGSIWFLRILLFSGKKLKFWGNLYEICFINGDINWSETKLASDMQSLSCPFVNARITDVYFHKALEDSLHPPRQPDPRCLPFLCSFLPICAKMFCVIVRTCKSSGLSLPRLDYHTVASAFVRMTWFGEIHLFVLLWTTL